MELVAIVAGLALVEYIVILMRTGQARGKFGVAAPATTGHPIFERHFRVQENTLEQLAIFLPSLYLCAAYASEGLAVLGGLVFIAGRAIYARAYVADPARRGPGFLLTFASNVVLLVAGLIGALLGWV